MTALPAWTEDGWLPEGRHLTSWSDAHERLVIDAPTSEIADRRTVFEATQALVAVVRRHIAHGRAIIDGGIARRDGAFPVHTELAIIPANLDDLDLLERRRQEELELCFSLGDVFVGDGSAGYWPIVPATSGLVHAFLVYPPDEPVWLDDLSVVGDSLGVPIGKKGSVEVEW